MARRQHRYVGFVALGLAMFSPAAGNAQEPDDLAPYKMVRSLQFVQDSVVSGDHSAGEMQRFMLGTIDERLRTVDPSIFDDDRNVDAALIYAMSGGNPQTLEYLIAHDVNGYFDNRVTDVLRKYLSGKGLLVAKTLEETAREYRDKKIGPYLALIGGNVLIATKPTDALDLYDQARLAAPGTIVEEAALRRSVAICVDKGMLDKGMAYSQRYVRRFLHSPYASQFADLFVTLVVGHDHDVKPQDVIDILSFMDAPRQREVYLRIARAAAISGKPELARMAVGRVQSLGGTDNAFGPLADFYGGMAGLPTEDIDRAAKNVSGIDGNALSPRDQALQEAARSVAEQILRAPDPASLTQASDPNTDHQEITSEKAAAIAAQPGAPGALPEPVPGGVASTGQGQDTDPSFNAFVTTNRSKLDEIDGLLAQEGNEQ
ncbi:chemotaxis protein [Rhizobium leguminosarum]|uniref:chemotaxis protein MotC n=1 Tax=Rhizobium leguminosarum TaxID=384 RepID=UPI0010326BCE|nr:chemotaxis protein MotC [Rhizobium leguminosarum]TAV47064.1 chemotaxis protein [Rhizobium leguminosarum]TAV56645.1 chemotaxis protein [Rhizobium leguminosarum]TAV67581.1 chemotaxis protein [Rhizobium leguminosarum]